jgi:hypothetical protein
MSLAPSRYPGVIGGDKFDIQRSSFRSVPAVMVERLLCQKP